MQIFCQKRTSRWYWINCRGLCRIFVKSERRDELKVAIFSNFMSRANVILILNQLSRMMQTSCEKQMTHWFRIRVSCKVFVRDKRHFEKKVAIMYVFGVKILRCQFRDWSIEQSHVRHFVCLEMCIGKCVIDQRFKTAFSIFHSSSLAFDFQSGWMYFTLNKYRYHLFFQFKRYVFFFLHIIIVIGSHGSIKRHFWIQKRLLHDQLVNTAKIQFVISKFNEFNRFNVQKIQWFQCPIVSMNSKSSTFNEFNQISI